MKITIVQKPLLMGLSLVSLRQFAKPSSVDSARRKSWLICMGVTFIVGWQWLFSPSAIHAQNCDPTLKSFYRATTNVCRQIGLGEVCYGSDIVTAKTDGSDFNAQGKRTSVASLTIIATSASTGSVLMYARSNTGPVK